MKGDKPTIDEKKDSADARKPIVSPAVDVSTKVEEESGTVSTKVIIKEKELIVEMKKPIKEEIIKESTSIEVSMVSNDDEKMIVNEKKTTVENTIICKDETLIDEDKKPIIVEKKPEVKSVKSPEENKMPEAHSVKPGSSSTPITTIKVEKETDVKPSSASKSTRKSTETPTKSEIKREPGSSSKHSSLNTKSSSHHSSSHHKSHSSSSHHKSSSTSHKSSGHSSSKDCSRCYRRSKIKKTNIGVQVRTDESNEPKPPTRPLEFEASHRVGVNRRPVVINTSLSYLKYGRFYHIEVHPNGGASIVHMYQDELDTLSQEEMNEVVNEFFELVFSEDENGFAHHVMGIVHDGARYLPDLLEHMAENYSNLTVKSGVLGRNNDIETCTMMQYYDQVLKTYDEGTVRYGPLHQISLVGKVHEEVGGYFPDLLGKLEQSPFLKKSMPWGKLSIVQMDPRLSNDGPILWIRPGEQLIPTAEMTKTPLKRQRARINELRNLQYLPRSSEAREIMFEDRTKAHADHVGMGHERQTTAAVGKSYSSC